MLTEHVFSLLLSLRCQALNNVGYQTKHFSRFDRHWFAKTKVVDQTMNIFKVLTSQVITARSNGLIINTLQLLNFRFDRKYISK